MSTFTWTLPAPSSPSSPPSNSVTTPPGALFGLLDQEIDPATLDYIDTDAEDGAWAETESSRTAVMMQLEIRYGEWFVDPEAGSRIPAMLETGDPVLPAEIVDEVRRALQLLVDDGIIADLIVLLGDSDDASERVAVAISYTDRSSGHAVDLVFSPS